MYLFTWKIPNFRRKWWINKLWFCSYWWHLGLFKKSVENGFFIRNCKIVIDPKAAHYHTGWTPWSKNKTKRDVNRTNNYVNKTKCFLNKTKLYTIEKKNAMWIKRNAMWTNRNVLYKEPKRTPLWTERNFLWKKIET